MRKILIMLSLLVSLGLPLFAEGRVISLEDAISSAMENNTDMEVARLKLQQSLRNASDASSYIPDLSLTGTANIGASIINQSWNATGDFNVGVTMNLGTSLIGSAAVNSATRTLAQLSYASSVTDVEKGVTSTYLSLASSKRSMESAAMDLESAKRTYESMKESYDAGLSSALELNNAELALSNYEYAYNTLKDSYELAKESFRILTGIEGEFEVEDVKSVTFLDLPSSDELYAKYANSTTSIRTLNATVALREASLTSTRLNTVIPSVNLRLNYDIGGNAYHNYSNENGFRDTASATLTFTVPISSYIPGSSANNSLRSAEDDVAISKVNLKAGKDALKNSIESMVRTLGQTEVNIGILERSVEIAERSYELSKESYGAGLITASALQDAQDELSAARLKLIDAESDYIEGSYNLAYLLNTDYESLVSLYAEIGE